MNRKKLKKLAVPHLLFSLKKLSLFALVFSFILSPVAPALAEELPLIPIESTVVLDTISTTVEISHIDSNNLSSQVDNSDVSNVSLKEDISKTNFDQVGIDLKSSDLSTDQTDLRGLEDSQITSLSQVEIGTPPEKANTSLTSISLPNINRATGSMNYYYDINITPGRNGLNPNISLHYDSQNKNDGMLGVGWSVNIPYIQRLNKTGTDNLYSSDYFISSIDGELVSIGSGVYSPKVENGQFLKYELGSNSWTVTDKSGTVYKFGNQTSSRLDNPSDSSKVYKWMLEEIRDTNDNYIKYEYTKDGGQIYPDIITYTGNGETDGAFTINFNLDSRDHNLVSYESGFLVTTNYDISEIKTEINQTWVRKYDLTYANADNGVSLLLKTITESGQDELNNITTLPAEEFDYRTSNPGWTYDQSLWALPYPMSIDSYNNDGGERVADINGDGLPDVLCYNYSQDGNVPCNFYNPHILLNNGSGWTESSTWEFPLVAGAGTVKESFATQYLTDNGLRLVDINGDGYTDLINGWAPTAKHSYINNKIDGWDYTSSWNPPVSFLSNGVDTGARMSDINGDSLPDIICHSHNDTDGPCQEDDPHIWINNGSGWTESSTWEFPLVAGAGTVKESFADSSDQDTFLRIIDVNGDSLPDLVNGTNGYIYLNNGTNGWDYASSWSIPAAFNYGGVHDVGMRVADINGDNLADLVCHNGSTLDIQCKYSTPKIWLNNNYSGWNDESSTWVFPGIYGGTESFVTNTFADNNLRIFDVNGDNLPDFVLGWPSNTYTYLNNNLVGSNLLTNIIYPQGGNTEITYKSSTQYMDGSTILNPNMRQNIDVVDEIYTHDGLGNMTSNNTYVYKGGNYYFDTYLNRRFAGFSEVVDTDSAGNKIITFYHQGNGTDSSNGEYDDHISKVGKIYRTEARDSSGNIYSETINKWDKYNIGTDHNFVKLTQSVNLTYDGDSDHKDKAVTYSYDNTNGNITEKIDWGEVIASTDGTFTDTGTDKSTTSITYASNTGANIIGLPSQETTVDQNSNKVNENKYYYDNQTLGNVTDGNLTKQEKWKDSANYVNTQKAYNTTYGIPTSSTDERGKVTSYSYDSYNIYPTTVTDPLNQTVQYVYDYSLGKPKQTTNQNGFIYQTIYDGLDRVIEEKIPGFSSPYTPVTKATYAYTDTSGAVAIHKVDYLDSSNTVDTYQYFDGLNRLIQERKEAENSGDFNVKDTVYNNIGLVQKQSLPYTSTGSSKTSPTTTNSLYVTNTYDPLQRILTTVDATGTTSYAYDDWKTTITDKNGNNKSYYKDARDNLVRVDEVDDSSTYTTNYEWNLNNKLTKITDALSNIRNFTYDGLGRRLTAQDLHASGDNTFGTWSYTYDDAGNITQTISPNSLTTNYTYNDINQQLTEDTTGVAGTEITYTYGGCTNGIEKLCTVTMTSGANTAYAYDSNGNTASEVKTINSTSYTTAYTYDRQGNKLVITYPDNAEVRYTFNTAGLLEKIERKESGGSFTDVISNFNYNSINQITTQDYINGLTTTNTYDEDHLYRLTNKETCTSSCESPETNYNPVINLTGSNYIVVNTNDTWSEPGYSATDTEDGNLTGSVIVDGFVNTSTPGTYQLVYSVVDSEGAPATSKIRTVVVQTPTNMTVKALIIGGGGGGGLGYVRQGGGGGAGYYQENNSVSITPQEYNIIVGNGGSKATNYSNGSNGGYSSALGLTSIGGGGGASGGPSVGSNGGNGGGGAGGSSGSNSGGTGTQYNGGDGKNAGGSLYRTGGGGGGAGAVGQNSTYYNGGNGGNGVASSITGTSITRAGGGGGAGDTRGLGGSGGGGYGCGNNIHTNMDGTNNTGSGGGGCGDSAGDPGNGGSGVVIISYHTDGSDGVSSTSTGGTITTSGDYMIHTFNISGTFTAINQYPSSNNHIPTITLTGEDFYDLNVDATWSEPGYFATDTEDGSLTGSMTITGSVDTGTVGVYQIVYSVVDSSGVPAERKIRTVYVHTPASSPNMQELSYSYDNIGNITQIIDSSDTASSKTANYVYDDLNRLTSATITGVASGQSPYTYNYAYDALGNILTSPIGTYLYQGTNYANPHASTSINGITNSYDNDGNLTGNGTLSNTWNYKDQLTQAVVGAVTSTYTYDYAGERASLSNGTTTTIYPNDLYNTNGTKQTKSIYAGNQLVATIETVGGVVTPYYTHTDHLGSTNTTSDNTGALVETLDYYPYGNQRISSGAHTEQRQYIGQMYDGDTGLNYLNARYYKSDVGKFIGQDPAFKDVGSNNFQSKYQRTLQEHLANPQTLNSYSYSNNNPITYNDPEGKIAFLPLLAYIYSAYSAAQLSIDAYDVYNTNIKYSGIFTPQEKLETNLNAGVDFVTTVVGAKIGRDVGNVAEVGFDTLTATMDVFNTYLGDKTSKNENKNLTSKNTSTKNSSNNVQKNSSYQSPSSKTSQYQNMSQSSGGGYNQYISNLNNFVSPLKSYMSSLSTNKNKNK